MKIITNLSTAMICLLISLTSVNASQLAPYTVNNILVVAYNSVSIMKVLNTDSGKKYIQDTINKINQLEELKVIFSKKGHNSFDSFFSWTDDKKKKSFIMNHCYKMLVRYSSFINTTNTEEE